MSQKRKAEKPVESGRRTARTDTVEKRGGYRGGRWTGEVPIPKSSGANQNAPAREPASNGQSSGSE